MAARPLSEVSVGDVVGPVTVPVSRADARRLRQRVAATRTPSTRTRRSPARWGCPTSSPTACGRWAPRAPSSPTGPGDAGRVVEFGTRFTKPVVVPRRRQRGRRARASSRPSTPRRAASRSTSRRRAAGRRSSAAASPSCGSTDAGTLRRADRTAHDDAGRRACRATRRRRDRRRARRRRARGRRRRRAPARRRRWVQPRRLGCRVRRARSSRSPRAGCTSTPRTCAAAPTSPSRRGRTGTASSPGRSRRGGPGSRRCPASPGRPARRRCRTSVPTARRSPRRSRACGCGTAPTSRCAR